MWIALAPPNPQLKHAAPLYMVSPARFWSSWRRIWSVAGKQQVFRSLRQKLLKRSRYLRHQTTDDNCNGFSYWNNCTSEENPRFFCFLAKARQMLGLPKPQSAFRRLPTDQLRFRWDSQHSVAACTGEAFFEGLATRPSNALCLAGQASWLCERQLAG